jgi:hypothetical protein
MGKGCYGSLFFFILYNLLSKFIVNCMKCPTCDFQYEKIISLSIHYRKVHKGTAKQLRIDLFHNGKEPTCACGCGTPTKFMSVEKGFTEYAWGHQAKIKNNWGHNEEARSNSLKKRREEGLWSKDPWNRGKTKQNDSEFARIAEKAYGNEKFRSDRSKTMKTSWESGAITPLTGSAHSQWRGGTSALGPLCRSKIYRTWSFPKLQAAGFKCSRCDTTRDLEVHHDGERFAEILHKGIATLGEPGEDWDRKECFTEWVVWYHVAHDVSGLVLCATCHAVEHGTQLTESCTSEMLL